MGHFDLDFSLTMFMIILTVTVVIFGVIVIGREVGKLSKYIKR